MVRQFLDVLLATPVDQGVVQQRRDQLAGRAIAKRIAQQLATARTGRRDLADNVSGFVGKWRAMRNEDANIFEIAIGG